MLAVNELNSYFLEVRTDCHHATVHLRHMRRGIEINTPLFEGTVRIWVDGVDSTPPGFKEQVPLPAPRSRVTLQGRFKRSLPFASLLTGQVGLRLSAKPSTVQGASRTRRALS